MNKGFTAMFVGYDMGSQHSGIYRMLNLKTRKVTVTKDIKWMNMLYGEYMKSKNLSQESDEEEMRVMTMEEMAKEDKEEANE